MAVLTKKERAPQNHGAVNMIPEFDPQAKNQSMKDWLQKIDESASVYGWTERQTIFFALPRLTGLAKRWYDGLTSVKYSWLQWQEKLLKAFPCEDNYEELLTEMLARRTRRNESLEEYYYDKMRLINRCQISKEKAVDCLTHGIFDNNTRMSAQGMNFSEPEEVLTYFRKIFTKRDDQSKKPGNFKESIIPNKDPQRAQASDNKKSESTQCYNCGETGHRWTACHKDLIRCGKCRRVGHTSQKCDNPGSSKATSDSTTTKKVLKLQSGSDSSDKKYYKDVILNGQKYVGFVDFGSACTLVSDQIQLPKDAQHDYTNLPLLKGFGNGMINPNAKVSITVKVDNVEEDRSLHSTPSTAPIWYNLSHWAKTSLNFQVYECLKLIQSSHYSRLLKRPLICVSPKTLK